MASQLQPTVPIERVRAGTDRIWCIEEHCALSAEACTKRRVQRNGARRGVPGPLYPKCQGCPDGARVAERLGLPTLTTTTPKTVTHHHQEEPVPPKPAPATIEQLAPVEGPAAVTTPPATKTRPAKDLSGLCTKCKKEPRGKVMSSGPKRTHEGEEFWGLKCRKKARDARAKQAQKPPAAVEPGARTTTDHDAIERGARELQHLAQAPERQPEAPSAVVAPVAHPDTLDEVFGQGARALRLVKGLGGFAAAEKALKAAQLVEAIGWEAAGAIADQVARAGAKRVAG